MQQVALTAREDRPLAVYPSHQIIQRSVLLFLNPSITKGVAVATARIRQISNHLKRFPGNIYVAPIGAFFFVLKFVRSRGVGARFLQPFPKSLVTIKYY